MRKIMKKEKESLAYEKEFAKQLKKRFKELPEIMQQFVWIQTVEGRGSRQTGQVVKIARLSRQVHYHFQIEIPNIEGKVLFGGQQFEQDDYQGVLKHIEYLVEDLNQFSDIEDDIQQLKRDGFIYDKRKYKFSHRDKVNVGNLFKKRFDVEMLENGRYRVNIKYVYPIEPSGGKRIKEEKVNRQFGLSKVSDAVRYYQKYLEQVQEIEDYVKQNESRSLNKIDRIFTHK